MWWYTYTAGDALSLLDQYAQVLSYVDVLRGKVEVGRRVAVIGAGGIGFDVSEYLLGEKALETPADERLEDIPSFLKVCMLSLFSYFGIY